MPRRWTLAGMLLALWLTMSPVALAQVATTQVADTIYRADGSAAQGSVVVSWPAFSTAAGQSVPAGSITVPIAAGGALSVQLAPNAGSNPMGSYYTAVYHLNDGSVSREYWVVPVSGSPVKIGAIKSTVLPLAVAQQTVSKSYVDQAIAQAVSGGVTVPQDGTGYVRVAGDTMTGPLNLSADPTSASQAADKHYVDTSVQQVAAGAGQKVSLVPQGTQVVAQPTGSQLSVNRQNGEEYASQYASGSGNNGIANAVASADCVNGCEVKAEQSYNSIESFNPAAFPDQTHVEDARSGGKREVYTNPGSLFNFGQSVGQTIDLVATKNTALVNGSIVTPIPSSVSLVTSIEALTGGNNLNPASIATSYPYSKTNYVAQQTHGVFNTPGQHSLSGHEIHCYGVGDCLIGSQFITASGGFRDEADEGAHPFDRTVAEDTLVFAGTCAAGCSTGSTNVTITPTAAPGTQGEGRFLIDKTPSKVISAGVLTGGQGGSVYPLALFSGTSFPVSAFFWTSQIAPSQANNIAPGTVVMPIQTTGVPNGYATNTTAAPAASGVACVADKSPSGGGLPHNYEMAPYSTIDGTHFQLTLNKVHALQSTIAIGGLCGYGLEQTVDTQNGIRQVFPVVGSNSPTSLYYAGGQTAIVGISNETSGYANVQSGIAQVSRTGGLVTLTAPGNFPQNVNGLTLTVNGVADSSYNGTFTVTTTGPNTLTYAQSGPDSTSTGGTLSMVTGGYALYPMAEVLGVMNPATKKVDGQMTLAPNTVAWSTGDVIEQPHYYQQKIAADQLVISQTVPRPRSSQETGVYYAGSNAVGLVGWQIANLTSPQSYFGLGGTHQAPSVAYSSTGVWQTVMDVQAGEQSTFNVHCNGKGCGRWDSGYDLFQLDAVSGADTLHYSPQINRLDVIMGGVGYQFTPQSFTAGTINVGTINAGTINGQVSGASITSGAVSANYLPMLKASGSTHAPGIVPDPGSVSGTSRYLREDGTWSIPAGGSSNPVNTSLVPGATADYNFLQGSGQTVVDSSGNNNNGTLVASAAPAWTGTGLTFQTGQGVSLPASLNGTQTYFLGLYINPLTAGGQGTNQYPVLISSSAGGSGFNFMYGYSLGPNGNFVPFTYAPTLYVGGRAATVTPNLLSGFHVLAVVLGTGSGSSDHVYIDGVEVANYTTQGSSAGAATSGNLFLGSSGVNPWTISGLNGTMYRFRTYPTQLAASSVQLVSAAIASEVGARGVPTAPVNIPQASPQLQAIGDSITFGLNVATPWPSLLNLVDQPNYNITNWGISGISLSAITGSEPNRAALRCKTSSGPSIAVIFAGTNDFSIVGTTPATIFTNLMGEVQTMKQAGCLVLVGTMLSRGGNDVGGNSFDADKDAYDALILSRAKVSGADGIIDFAANPLMGADGANAGAGFQADHIHPTQAGQAALAAQASNVLNYIFGANQTNPHVVTTPNYVMTAGDGYISLSGLTGASTLTLPDCTGQSGATYQINNPQATYAVSVAPFAPAQAINGLGSIPVPANATVTLRDTPNPKTIAGCHWEM